MHLDRLFCREGQGWRLPPQRCKGPCRRKRRRHGRIGPEPVRPSARRHGRGNHARRRRPDCPPKGSALRRPTRRRLRAVQWPHGPRAGSRCADQHQKRRDQALPPLPDGAGLLLQDVGRHQAPPECQPGHADRRFPSPRQAPRQWDQALRAGLPECRGPETDRGAGLRLRQSGQIRERLQRQRGSSEAAARRFPRRRAPAGRGRKADRAGTCRRHKAACR